MNCRNLLKTWFLGGIYCIIQLHTKSTHTGFPHKSHWEPNSMTFPWLSMTCFCLLYDHAGKYHSHMGYGIQALYEYHAIMDTFIITLWWPPPPLTAIPSTHFNIRVLLQWNLYFKSHYNERPSSSIDQFEFESEFVMILMLEHPFTSTLKAAVAMIHIHDFSWLWENFSFSATFPWLSRRPYLSMIFQVFPWPWEPWQKQFMSKWCVKCMAWNLGRKLCEVRRVALRTRYQTINRHLYLLENPSNRIYVVATGKISQWSFTSLWILNMA